jgi:hypothetical protein
MKSGVLRQQQGIGGRVRYADPGEQLLRSRLADVLVSASTALHDGLPLHRRHLDKPHTGRDETAAKEPVADAKPK